MPGGGYYPDGVTKITDPFYKCYCRRCRHHFWSVQSASPCPACGSSNVFRSFDGDEVKAEIARMQSI